MNLRGFTAPIWLMGMSNLSFGLYAGFITLSLPQLLAAQHVPEARIAAITATVISAGIWVFLLGPMLDVRFSRRFYATLFGAIAGICLTLTLLNRTNLVLVEVFMLIGFAAAQLNTNALGGWLATIVHLTTKASSAPGPGPPPSAATASWPSSPENSSAPSPSSSPHFFSASSSFSPPPSSSSCPHPAPTAASPARASPNSSAKSSPSSAAAKSSSPSPSSSPLAPPSPSPTPSAVSATTSTPPPASSPLVGGAGLSLAGIFGALLFVPFAKLLPLRPLYLAIGAAGALFTSSLILLHHTPSTFVLAMIGENVFQALAYTGITAISFETIGRNNPLAATTYSLFNATSLIPLVLMQVIDGRAYSWHGVTGSFLADASIGLLACALLGLMLRLVRTPQPHLSEAAH